MRAPAPTITTILVACLATFALSACAPPAPEPSPTPTGFASEEEAFAAAEETYRAYVDAANAAREEEADFDASGYLTGQALIDEEAAADSLEASGRLLKGPTRINSFEGDWWGPREVSAYACLNLESVKVLDSSGEDVTPPDRATEGLFEVRFRTDASGTRVIQSTLWRERC